MCPDRFKIDVCYRYLTPSLSMLTGLRNKIVHLLHYKGDTFDIVLTIEKETRCVIATVPGDRYVRP